VPGTFSTPLHTCGVLDGCVVGGAWPLFILCIPKIRKLT
jgi:hypothetical protein